MAARFDVGFPPMEPVGMLTLPSGAELVVVGDPSVEPGTIKILPEPNPPVVAELEKNPVEPLQTAENVANVAANMDEVRPPSMRRYKDLDKRRKYMREFMAKKRKAAKSTRGKS